MMLGFAVGTVAGSWMLTSGGAGWTTTALGATLAAYAGWTPLARAFLIPRRAERWLSPLIGLAMGVVTGGTGIFVIPAVPYLQALSLGRDELIQAFGLSFTVSTIALAVGLAWHGAFQPDTLALSSLTVLPALVGMWLRRRIRQCLSPARFRRRFLVALLLLLGTELAVRPLL